MNIHPHDDSTSPIPQVLVGCGILSKEVQWLIHKNGWTVDTHFLDSALHCNLARLHVELNEALETETAQGRLPAVFYGCCHPLMDKILGPRHIQRTGGQNCIDILLGYERFMAELERGAFFLLENWAESWKPIMTQTFGTNPAVIREIFQSSHSHILAIRTPCSADFSQAAQEAAQHVGLPLAWMDADLTHLEAVLADALNQTVAKANT